MFAQAAAKVIHCCAAAFPGVVAVVAGGAADVPARNSPLTILPEIRVSAEVPLVKVGEYQLVEKRFAAAAVAHGDFIYTLGGERRGLAVNSIERFNVRTRKSEPFAKLKEGRRWHRAAVVGNEIYVLGGYNDLGGWNGPSASVEIIDLSTGRVSSGPKMPKGRANFACGFMGGKIYVVGGLMLKGKYLERGLVPENGGGTEGQKETTILARTNTMFVLDVATGKWTDGTAMPNPGEVIGAVVDGPFLVIAGGLQMPGRYERRVYVKAEELDQVVSFNPRDGTWRIQAPLHRHASAHSLTFLGQYLFLFGGRDAEKELVAYDFLARQSQSFTLGYKTAWHSAAVAHEQNVYVIGGRDAYDAVLDYIQVFELRKRKPGASESGVSK